MARCKNILVKSGGLVDYDVAGEDIGDIYIYPMRILRPPYPLAISLMIRIFSYIYIYNFKNTKKI